MYVCIIYEFMYVFMYVFVCVCKHIPLRTSLTGHPKKRSEVLSHKVPSKGKHTDLRSN